MTDSNAACCDQCHQELGDKYYAGVPKEGNLCLTCHKDWHRAKMAIGDYDAINEPVYHWEEVKTAAEIERTKLPSEQGVYSIGMCKLCGYKGPGPKHDCAAEGLLNSDPDKRKELVEAGAYYIKGVLKEPTLKPVVDWMTETQERIQQDIDRAIIGGVPGPPPKAEDQATKSQFDRMIKEEAAATVRPGTIDEWLNATSLSDIHRDIAAAIANRLERYEEALSAIEADLDSLGCGGNWAQSDDGTPGVHLACSEFYDDHPERWDDDAPTAESNYCPRCRINFHLERVKGGR